MLRQSIRVVRAVRTNSLAAASGAFATTTTTTKEETTATPTPTATPHKRTFKPMHYKLKSITKHINDTVLTTKSLGEAIDILDEGALYLREIEVAEKIATKDIYFRFQPLVEKLLSRFAAGEIEQGERLLVEVVEVMAKSQLANKRHFTEAATWLLKQGKVEQVVELWVKYLESKPEKEYRVNIAGYNHYTLDSLAYFSLVSACLAKNQPFDPNMAKAIMKTDRLPEFHQVGASLRTQKLDEQYADAFKKFRAEVGRHETSTQDPNGTNVYRRLRDAVDRKNVGQVNSIFDFIKKASVAQNKPLVEATVVRVMDAYYALERPQQAIDLFYELVRQETTPLDQAWMLYLTCLGSPAYVRDLFNKDKSFGEFDTAAKVYMREFTVGPKSLSILASGYTNFGHFDHANELVASYGAKGVALINPAKNNLVYGLVFNGHIVQAEALFKKYCDDDPTYVALTTLMNTFLTHYAKKKNFDAVKQILHYMDTKAISYDVATYTVVVDSYFKEMFSRGQLANVDQVLATIKGIKVNDVFLTSLLLGLARQGNLELARLVFAHGIKKYPVLKALMTLMMAGELNGGDVHRAVLVFEYMKLVVPVSVRDYNTVITGLLAHNDTQAVEVYQEMKKTTLPNQFTWYYLFSHFTRQKNHQMVQMVLDDMADAKLAQLGEKLPKMVAAVASDYKVSPSLLHEVTSA